ncbi:hypothetical protein ACM1RC_25900 [Paenibacillus azoreducens]|uniref:hypothetical protein n=1 Tax=Paenibacillus azoreducens TaxID=116718 RepID=UPI0039F59D57
MDAKQSVFKSKAEFYSENEQNLKFHQLVEKLEACMLESGLSYKMALSALDKVRERYRCKGINFLNKVNIQEVEGEDHLPG